MNYITLVFSFVLLFTTELAICQENQLTPEQEEYLNWARDLWGSLDRQQGEIKLPNGVATLQVPDDFYYLNPHDSEKVLVEVWENPAGAGSETLGMLFPSESTPFDEGGIHP